MNFTGYVQQGGIHRLYMSVIEDVLETVRDLFLDDGLDENHIHEFAHSWQSKIDTSKALDNDNNQNNMQGRRAVAELSNRYGTINRMDPSRLHFDFSEFPDRMPLINTKTEPLDYSNNITRNERSAARMINQHNAMLVPPDCINKSQVANSLYSHDLLRNNANNLYHLQQHQQVDQTILGNRIPANQITKTEPCQVDNSTAKSIVNTPYFKQLLNNPQFAVKPTPSSRLNSLLSRNSSLYSQNDNFKNVFQPELINTSRKRKNPFSEDHKPPNNTDVPQFDGQLDPDNSSEDNFCVDDDEDDHIERLASSMADEASNMDELSEVSLGIKEESEPLNSDDDVSEDDPTDLFETDNIIVCQFDKINRSKSRWKFMLKEGIMNIKGKDYVFSKAQGEADW